MDTETRNELISTYFHKGYEYVYIQAILIEKHAYYISLVHLKRLLKRLGLHRYGHYSDVEDIVRFISEEVKGSGQQHGYRFMHQKCLNAGLRVPRNVVATAVRLLDPEGVELRKKRRLVRRRYHAKGPNNIWHIDSYDKLQAYGIGINAAIDGFSRKVIWAHAFVTNSDPRVIGRYYMDAVSTSGGCPRKIRVDAGTENHIIRKLQEFLTDDDNSCIVGVSTGNTRIESWWGQYRRANAEYFMSMLHQLASDGSFCGDSLDKQLMRFCFLNIIEVS